MYHSLNQDLCQGLSPRLEGGTFQRVELDMSLGPGSDRGLAGGATIPGKAKRKRIEQLPREEAEGRNHKLKTQKGSCLLPITPLPSGASETNLQISPCLRISQLQRVPLLVTKHAANGKTSVPSLLELSR